MAFAHSNTSGYDFRPRRARYDPDAPRVPIEMDAIPARPLHPSTSPEAIRRGQLRDVAEARAIFGDDAERIGEHVVLPAWNVRRLLAALDGVPWVWPAKSTKQNPARGALNPQAKALPAGWRPKMLRAPKTGAACARVVELLNRTGRGMTQKEMQDALGITGPGLCRQLKVWKHLFVIRTKPSPLSKRGKATKPTMVYTLVNPEKK